MDTIHLNFVVFSMGQIQANPAAIGKISVKMKIIPYHTPNGRRSNIETFGPRYNPTKERTNGNTILNSTLITVIAVPS